MEEIYKTYLTWDKSKTLKEKGFDEPCAGAWIYTKENIDPVYRFFDKPKPQKVKYNQWDLPMISYTQAALWLALKYNLYVSVRPKLALPTNEFTGKEWCVSIKTQYGQCVHLDYGVYEYHECWNHTIDNAIDLIHEIDWVNT